MKSEILTPFLNRAEDAFDPAGWYQLVPKGIFPITRQEKDGQVRVYQQVVDEQAIEKIVAAFNNRKASDAGFELLVDFDHFSHDTTKSSEAAGWINQMEARADGVWYKARWSDQGDTAIRNRRFRYISPVWFPNQTEQLGGNRFRPIQVNDAGLTNKPNLGDALQPFWNRAKEHFHGREATTEKTNQGKAMKDRLIQLFKLPVTATEDEVFAKATAFLNRASEADVLQGKVDTLTRDHTALKNRFDPLLAASVDGALETYKGVISEGAKDAWKNRLTTDFDGTVELLKGIKAPGDKKKPVHTPAGVDTTVKTEGSDDAFKNRANAITSKANELHAAAAGRRTFDSCWQQAQREIGAPKAE